MGRNKEPSLAIKVIYHQFLDLGAWCKQTVPDESDIYYITAFTKKYPGTNYWFNSTTGQFMVDLLGYTK